MVFLFISEGDSTLAGTIIGDSEYISIVINVCIINSEAAVTMVGFFFDVALVDIGIVG